MEVEPKTSATHTEKDHVTENVEIQEQNNESKGDKLEIQKEKSGGDHVIDIKAETKLKHEEASRVENICRICHLGNEYSSGCSELIQLGCGCKEELGLCHRLCAESWFTQRGNRFCEICGKKAKNINGPERVRPVAADWNGAIITLSANSYPLPEERSHRCKQSLCNIILACLILLIICLLPGNRWIYKK